MNPYITLVVCDTHELADRFVDGESIKARVINTLEDSYKHAGRDYRFINYAYDAPFEVRRRLDAMIRWVP
jgi:hypothetical protein